MGCYLALAVFALLVALGVGELLGLDLEDGPLPSQLLDKHSELGVVLLATSVVAILMVSCLLCTVVSPIYNKEKDAAFIACTLVLPLLVMCALNIVIINHTVLDDGVDASAGGFGGMHAIEIASFALACLYLVGLVVLLGVEGYKTADIVYRWCVGSATFQDLQERVAEARRVCMATGCFMILVYVVALPATATAMHYFGRYDLQTSLLVVCSVGDVCATGNHYNAGTGEADRALWPSMLGADASDARYALFCNVSRVLTLASEFGTNEEVSCDTCTETCVLDIYPVDLLDSTAYQDLLLVAASPFLAALIISIIWFLCVNAVSESYALPNRLALPVPKREARPDWAVRPNRDATSNGGSANDVALLVLVAFSLFDVGSDIAYISTQDFNDAILFYAALSFLVLPTLLFMVMTCNRGALLRLMFSVNLSPLENETCMYFYHNELYEKPERGWGQLYELVMYAVGQLTRGLAFCTFSCGLIALQSVHVFAVVLFYAASTAVVVSFKLVAIESVKAWYYDIFVGNQAHASTPFAFNVAIMGEVLLESIPQIIVTLINASATDTLSDTVFIVTIVGSVLPILSNLYALGARVNVARDIFMGLNLSLVKPLPDAAELETLRAQLSAQVQPAAEVKV